MTWILCSQRAKAFLRRYLGQLLESSGICVRPVNRYVRCKSKCVLARLGPRNDLARACASLIVQEILARLGTKPLDELDVLPKLVVHSRDHPAQSRAEIRVERVSVGVRAVDGGCSRGCSRFRGGSEGWLPVVSASANASRGIRCERVQFRISAVLLGIWRRSGWRIHYIRKRCGECGGPRRAWRVSVTLGAR